MRRYNMSKYIYPLLMREGKNYFYAYVMGELMNQIVGDFTSKVREQLHTYITQNQPKMRYRSLRGSPIRPWCLLCAIEGAVRRDP